MNTTVKSAAMVNQIDMMDLQCYHRTHFNPSRLQILHVTVLVCSIASIIGMLFLLLSAVLFKTLREFPARMTIYLCVSFLISTSFCAVGALIDLSDLQERVSFDVCWAQNMCVVFGFQCGFTWFAAIIFNLYRTICMGKNGNGAHLESIYHLVSWGSGALWCAVAFSTGPLGWQDPRCSFDTDAPSLWSLLLYYCPLFAIWLLGFIALVRISHRIYSVLKDRARPLAVITQMRLVCYGFIFMFFPPLGLANHILSYYTSSKDDGDINKSPLRTTQFVVYWLYTFTVCFQGGLLFLLLGCTSQMWRLYRGVIMGRRNGGMILVHHDDEDDGGGDSNDSDHHLRHGYGSSSRGDSSAKSLSMNGGGSRSGQLLTDERSPLNVQGRLGGGNGKGKGNGQSNGTYSRAGSAVQRDGSLTMGRNDKGHDRPYLNHGLTVEVEGVHSGKKKNSNNRERERFVGRKAMSNPVSPCEDNLKSRTTAGHLSGRDLCGHKHDFHSLHYVCGASRTENGRSGADNCDDSANDSDNGVMCQQCDCRYQSKKPRVSTPSPAMKRRQSYDRTGVDEWSNNNCNLNNDIDAEIAESWNAFMQKSSSKKNSSSFQNPFPPSVDNNNNNSNTSRGHPTTNDSQHHNHNHNSNSNYSCTMNMPHSNCSSGFSWESNCSTSCASGVTFASPPPPPPSSLATRPSLSACRSIPYSYYKGRNNEADNHSHMHYHRTRISSGGDQDQYQYNHCDVGGISSSGLLLGGGMHQSSNPNESSAAAGSSGQYHHHQSAAQNRSAYAADDMNMENLAALGSCTESYLTCHPGSRNAQEEQGEDPRHRNETVTIT
eukprot:Nk52_evm4s1737 gene=Nk52_evmTU4s1737